MARTLIACLGNIFWSDDGFGVAVAQRLAGHQLGEGVRVTDYGIRGMHLAYDLAEGWDATILVDATRRGGEPGTVYVIEPQAGQRPGEPWVSGTPEGREQAGRPPAADGMMGALLLDPHGMQPDVMLGMAGTLGAQAGRVLLVGCEPASLEEGIGLSEPVASAVDEAVAVITRLARGGPASHGHGEGHPGGTAEGSGAARCPGGVESPDSGDAATKE